MALWPSLFRSYARNLREETKTRRSCFASLKKKKKETERQKRNREQPPRRLIPTYLFSLSLSLSLSLLLDKRRPKRTTFFLINLALLLPRFRLGYSIKNRKNEQTSESRRSATRVRAKERKEKRKKNQRRVKGRDKKIPRAFMLSSFWQTFEHVRPSPPPR